MLKITIQIPLIDVNNDKVTDLADVSREIKIIKLIWPTAGVELVED